jgi:predicted nuclease of predicted toxin-antitoxin system
MKFWLDAQLSHEIAAGLGSRLRADVEAVKYLGLRDATDNELFDAARRFGNVVIITKDADFADLVRRRGAPPQIVWLTCGNLTNLELVVLLTRELPAAMESLRGGMPLVQIKGDAE